VLRTLPDLNNWSEIPNVRDEVHQLILSCDWYKIYDICEALRGDLSIYGRADEFTHQLNELFEEEEGI